ncbi:translation repressor protein [uncultured Caudovirales phage]|uniref:Translation repressor protein n=1 Tax=uncultured Caudovirales phage TaxID=2100421 RepID=A0A6J5PF90_9CAUD|nr:translation repressor protein [uncultured Caudovirales phage]CAB4176469.1 translation repressor protein [uncultured Caudovirales phage]CAB4181875.1 translation repressor protein [uncultured Caudovirales phage]CAB4190151.1 translation repressor protein [uncultured Caudovirales phage]CAB4210640.1 translation repressor protein [uncultured Caudovirales phage]
MLNLSELIEVTLPEPDDFLKIRETLSRIGVASKKDRTLYQSCHILHKQGKYYILHFKQLFLLDGKKSDFSDDDKGRLNTIANLLAEWNLLALVDRKKSEDPVSPLSQIKILSHKEKDDWILVTKYNIGKKRRED